MSDLDLQGLHDDIIEIIVQSVYMRHGPAPMPGTATPERIAHRKTQAINEYHQNPRFRTVVDIMTAAIIRATENRHR